MSPEEPGPESDGSPDIMTSEFQGSLARLVALARSHRIDVAALPLDELMTQLEHALATEMKVSLSRSGEWLMLGVWLVWLRSTLLAPQDGNVLPDTVVTADALRSRRDDLQAGRALAAWLDRRPRLGSDVFPRGRPEEQCMMNPNAEPRIDVIEFLWTAMQLLGPPPDPTLFESHYRPVSLPLFTFSQAREWVRVALGADGARIRQFRDFLPEVASPPGGKESDTWLRSRSAVTSTFSACLEMVKMGDIILSQPEPWQEMTAERRGAADR